MSRILFLLEDYNLYYTRESEKILQKKPGITYRELLTELLSRKYYQSDSMAASFREMGYPSDIVVPESNPLQKLWLREKNSLSYFRWMMGRPMRSLRSRVLKQFRTSFNHIQFITLLHQVKYYKPNVVYFYSNIFITAKQVNKLKSLGLKVVLQWSSPIWKEQPDFPYQEFHLIVTAAPQLKEYFSGRGYKSIYLQQAFDTSILQTFDPKRKYKSSVIFIGGFSLGHDLRYETLEFLLRRKVGITVHGTGKEFLPENALLRKTMKEPLFGLEMYDTYRQYRMAIHIHTTGVENDGIDWNKYAGAKRLFEITGSGTLLLTSHQENIKDLFEIGTEVVTFRNKEDLLEKINYYLAHPQEAESIALRGQQRTLKDHSFSGRAKELSKVLFNS